MFIKHFYRHLVKIVDYSKKNNPFSYSLLKYHKKNLTKPMLLKSFKQIQSLTMSGSLELQIILFTSD